MKELIERIAKALVDEPEQVQVTETATDKLLVLELQVAKEDIGKVIGKQGRTARAIRTLLQASSAKKGKRATLEIIDQ
jgi:predicted RNA-binding protein YlqC (UPF0109 family)